jgi:hypothetical protein
VPRNRKKIGAESIDITGIRPAAWTASTCRTPPASWSASSLRNRLNDAGFVIGQHERNQRPAALAPPGIGKRAKVDPPIAGGRHPRTARLQTAPGQHRRMLDRRDQQPVERLPIGPLAGASASMLASVPPEVNTTLRGSARRARRPARGPPRSGAGRRGPRRAPRTDCRRTSSAPCGGARLRPQRSGCVPVEVDTLGHGL